MPHLQLTLTRNLLADAPVVKLLSDLVTALSTFDTVDPAAVKAYVTVPELYISGPGTTGKGAHLTVCLMEGRESKLLKRSPTAFLRSFGANTPSHGPTSPSKSGK